ncbi:hypothetical protein EON65_25535 [archaeon]|nr:MAG: hypothetical protein EON65_25535 [archaeon]
MPKGNTNKEVLGPFEVDEVKRPKSKSKKVTIVEETEKPDFVSTDKKEKKRRQEVDTEEEENGKEIKKDKKKSKKSRKSLEEGEENEEMDGSAHNEESNGELSLGERLEQLSKQLYSIESASVIKPMDTPTADSLVTLLDQALQSGDEELLEQCLSRADMAIITSTTQKLSTHRVLILLKKLVAKFERRPSRGLLITQWLSAVLRQHLAYLITVPDLTRQLAGLSQILEQRTQSYTRLASLAGRLDLLMTQVSSSRELAQKDTAFQPAAVYHEDD